MRQILTEIGRVTEPGIAAFVTRWVLGIVFTMQGWWKVFELGIGEHAQRYFVTGYADSWIPEWLLQTLGVAIPPFELAAGILLLIGLRVREVLFGLGLLLIIITYGYALKEPLLDIKAHLFTRLALVILLLLIPRDSDTLSLDHHLRARRGQ